MLLKQIGSQSIAPILFPRRYAVDYFANSWYMLTLLDTAHVPLGQMTLGERILSVLNSMIARVLEGNLLYFSDATLAKGYFILVVAIWVTYHTHGLSHGSPLPETALSVLFQSDIMIMPLQSVSA